MRGKPIGSNVYLYVDVIQEVMVGDFIQPLSTVTRRPTKTYLVTAVREQMKGKYGPRYAPLSGALVRRGRQHLRCDVVPLEAPQEGDIVHQIVWYGRG